MNLISSALETLVKDDVSKIIIPQVFNMFVQRCNLARIERTCEHAINAVYITRIRCVDDVGNLDWCHIC